MMPQTPHPTLRVFCYEGTQLCKAAAPVRHNHELPVFDCAEILVNVRADLTSLRQGRTSLDIARAQGHESIVQLIARALAAEAGGA